ncbi:uncharacterized protein SCHCODRAFT_02554891 [Schizophyllum commune H4-8]|nr:uncharacterized protein SCHCODRAFT_02554891 [Schizophyllum commune H4-8]KAI5887288.1 hypothetical protein SCHCODRAFT_02554891 [Schizophyllum commune H4-8]
MRSNHALLAPVTPAFDTHEQRRRVPASSIATQTYPNEQSYDHEPMFEQHRTYDQQLPDDGPAYDQQMPYDEYDDNKENIPQLAQDDYTEISSLDYTDYDMPAARSPSFFSSAIDYGHAGMDDR